MSLSIQDKLDKLKVFTETFNDYDCKRYSPDASKVKRPAHG